ncbi:MAG: hypothetical protein ACXW2F_06870 [Thermoanaerobaculia bacterium]
MNTRSLASLVCTLMLGLAAPQPTLAQRANGPYSGVLGGQPDENRTQGLDLHGSMFGAWDENMFPASEATRQLDPRLKQSGASAGVSGSLAYDRRGDRAQFVLNGGANAREYASSPNLVAAYQAATMLTANLTPKLMFNAGGSASYSPFFQFAPFLDVGMSRVGPLTGNFGYAALAERNMRLDASVGLTNNFTKRTSLFITASGREWRLLDDPQNNLRSWGAHAGIRHNLTRGLGVHLGYGRDQNEYAFAGMAPYVNQTIDAGVDYNETLSFARRTALSFSTSTQAIRYNGGTHYRLNGSARLTRGFRRSWSTWIGYDRNTEFRIGFRAPLLTDSVNAGIAGLATRRIKWSAGAGYTHGTIGFDANAFSAYGGTVRADLALTRMLALFGQYAYYHYEVPPGSSVLDLVPRFSRQVATVGLTVWVPLIKDVRAPEQPR